AAGYAAFMTGLQPLLAIAAASCIMQPFMSRLVVQPRFFECQEPFPLQSGAVMPGFTLAYETYGRLNADKSNAILLFHALTGSQHAAGWCEDVPGVGGRWTDEMREGWWEEFIGP